MVVGELKAVLDIYPDDTKVVIDTEARCFNAHMVETDSAFLLEAKHWGGDENLFVINPNWSDTSHFRNKPKD